MRIQLYVCFTAWLLCNSAILFAHEDEGSNMTRDYASLTGAVHSIVNTGKATQEPLTLNNFIRVSNERGCCVYKIPGKAKCAVSSEDYCVEKATKAKLKYEFIKGKSCKEVPACN